MNLNLNYIGRLKIFTDVKEINRDNVVSVLKKAYSIHRQNAWDMQYLIDYEAGIQPLPYTKEVRPEIDIKTCDNMANYVTEFWKGYFWGTPPIYTQRGNKSHDGTDEAVDSSGISALNEMMLNGLSIGRERQTLADFVEKFLQQGTQICVLGRLQTRNYEDKNGIRRYVTEVIAEEISFADSFDKIKSDNTQETVSEDLKEKDTSEGFISDGDDLPF